MTPKRRTEKKPGKQPRSGADPAMSIGIDLGTTRTVVSLADRGNYPVAGFTDLFGDDHDFLPSLSALTDEGLVHGFEARRAARRGAPLVRSLKRRLSSPTASWSAPVPFGSTSLPLGEVLASGAPPCWPASIWATSATASPWPCPPTPTEPSG